MEIRQDIRKMSIETIASDYMRIYSLSEESMSILRYNLSKMTDEELGKEMDLIDVFYDSKKHAYQKGLVELIHFEESEEKIGLHPTLNF